MGQKGHKNSAVSGGQDRPRRWARRGLLGAGALAAVGALAACSGVATSETEATSAFAKFAPVAAGGSGQSQGQPAIIGRAIAHEKTRRTAGRPPRHRRGQPKPSGSASATPTATPIATPTGTPAGTPTPTRTGTAPSAPPYSAPTGGGSGTDPSGQNPATSLSGYTLKYTQEFTGGSLPANWTAYTGTPGGESSSVAQWQPGMCTFRGGEAHFMASGIDSCGMDYTGAPQQYGAWFARLQANAEPAGQLFTDIFLLWPDNNQWPPEIDVYEDGGDRSRTVATLWNTVGDACGSPISYGCLYQHTQTNGGGNGVANTGTAWHTYGVEWTPSGVSWLIDGRVIFTAPASAVKSPAHQPALTMDMALQSESLQGSGTPSTYDSMNVDWVEQFSWNG